MSVNLIFDRLSSETRALKSAMTTLLDLNKGAGMARKCCRKLQNRSQSEKFSKPATIKQNSNRY